MPLNPQLRLHKPLGNIRKIELKLKKQEQSKIWKLDKKTYEEIQKLKYFTDFISELELITPEQKLKVEKIKYLIENIDKSETHKQWNICLDIFDREIQDGRNDKEGFYWRKWSVYFESDSLEIEAESNHTSDDLGHYGDDFFYYGTVYFRENIEGQRVYLYRDLMEFINDVKDYKKYITKTLNDIDIDIDIWEIKV